LIHHQNRKRSHVYAIAHHEKAEKRAKGQGAPGKPRLSLLLLLPTLYGSETFLYVLSPGVLLQDLSNNKLSGPVEPPTAAAPPPPSPSGRRMLLQQPPPQQQPPTTTPRQQQQQQQQQQQAAETPRTPPQLTPEQRLRQQQQQGAIMPSGEMNAPRTGPWQGLLMLSYLDLSNNQLTGEIGSSCPRNRGMQSRMHFFC